MTNRTKENKKLVFKNYGEYLYMTKNLSNHQKVMIFDSLSRDEKKSLEKALVEEGWDDLISAGGGCVVAAFAEDD